MTQQDDTCDLKTDIAVIKERLEAMDRALVIQAKEYDRRLHELNHAHEQAVEVQHTYVTSEVHERDLKAASDARAALFHTNERKAEALADQLVGAKTVSDERFARIEAFQAKILGALALALVFIPLLFTLVAFLVTKWAQ